MVAAAALAGLASPAAAANTFDSQWADATWTGTQGGTNSARMAAGRDNFNGAITEYLETTITGTFCASGALLAANLTGTEQAADLAGVALNTLAAKPTATVSRTTTLTGTITRTPASGKGCSKLTGPAVTTTNPTVTLTGRWSKPRTATLSTYSGSDCGGTGTCRYTQASPTGSFAFGKNKVTLGGTGTERWMWSGAWDLDAACPPVAGYPCS